MSYKSIDSVYLASLKGGAVNVC